MKKLLSICFLSILLATMSLVAQAQSSTNCCFWLENLQPDTLHNIANIPGGGAAALPGTGGDLVLNNTLNRVDTGNYAQTDFYLIRFSNTCGLPPTTKVSLEWELYRDGELVNGNLSDYADFRIYTRYNRLHNSTDPMTAGISSCGLMRWMGGPVSGQGTCIEYQNYCVGGYPGAMQVEQQFPYATDSYTAAGYINLANGYALDYFNLPFFEATDHVIAISWKQVGNYSLVVGLRERTGGTAYPSLYWTNEEGMQNTNLGAIGGHQSCCGELLAKDSIYYLVETNSSKAVCDGETYDYGQPVATFSVEGRYLVIFGVDTCEHFRVHHLDTLDFYTRINPNIKATDIEICHNVPFTSADLAALAPAVDTDAPGIVDYHVMWSTDNDPEWTETVPTPSTAVPGTYTYYVRQTNDYDAVTDDEFSCTGEPDTLTMVVLPLLDPIPEPVVVEICNEEIPNMNPLKLTAQLDPNEKCADRINWYLNGELVHTGFEYDVDLAELNPTNINKQIVYTLYAVSDYATSNPVTAPTVTLNFHQTPIINKLNADTLFVVCPDKEVTLKSNFTATQPTGTVLTYTWTRINVQDLNHIDTLQATTADVSVHAPLACSDTDIYVVYVLATSPDGCIAKESRRYSLISQDNIPITLIVKPTTQQEFTVSGCDTTTVNLPAVLTLNDLVDRQHGLVTVRDNCSNVNKLIYTPEIVSKDSCTTVYKRSYIVEDSCGNVSNPFVQTFTIVNDYKPVVSAGDLIVRAIPVMDCKFDAPVYEVLRAKFDSNFRITYECDTFYKPTVTFFFHDTREVVNGNHDIFAVTDIREVDVVVNDPCGNTSDTSHVFTMHRPPRILIERGSAIARPAEICLHDTVFLSFNYDEYHVLNATAPYTFEWKAEPNDGSIIHHTSPTAEGVPATPNIDYIYRMVLTDRWGCKDSSYTEPVHVWGIPTVYITPDIRNGAEFPLCPTYGVLTVEAHADAGVPNETISSYAWSGESVNVYSTNDTSGVYIIPDSCEHTYEVIVDVENDHHCPARGVYYFDVIDSVAPYFVDDNLITDSLVEVHENCVMYVPDFIPLFNNDNVKDNCYTLGQMQITQTPPAGTIIHGDTPVLITVTDGCGNVSVPYTITAKSANPIAVEIITSKDSDCYGYTARLQAVVTDAVFPVEYLWSTNQTLNVISVIPSEQNHVYSVTVTDAMGCEATDDIDLLVYHVPTRDDATLATTPNTYCDNEDGIYDGTISVASFNHPDVIKYRMTGENEWRDVDYVYTGLYQGVYHFDLLTIHDCDSIDVIQVEVEKDTNVVIPEVTTTPNEWCIRPFDGSITVTNPQVGYTYEIINLPNSERYYTEGTLIYEDLEYGHYSIHVLTDKYCTYVKEDIIVDSLRVYPTLEVSSRPQTSCETPNGTIFVINPVEGWTYTLGNTTLTGDPIEFGGLNHGTYNILVVTEKGCPKDFYAIPVPTETLNPADPEPVIEPNTVCNPDTTANGKITIPASHTIARYTYILGTTEVVADGTSDIVFDHLGQVGIAVTYRVTVISDLGCQSDFDYTIENTQYQVSWEDEIVVEHQTNCDPINPNGSITINPVPGNEYKVFQVPVNVRQVRAFINTDPWYDPSYQMHALENTSSLEYGFYYIVKTDSATGCWIDTTVQIEFNRPEYEFDLTINKDYDCSPAGNGSIIVNNPEGFVFYMYGVDEVNLTGVFEHLNGPTVYYITAINTETRCQYDTAVFVDSVVITPHVTATSTSANYYCNEHKNGSITLTCDLADVTFYLYGTDYADTNRTGNFEELDGGSYGYYIVSDNNCFSERAPIIVPDSAFIDTMIAHIVPNTMCEPTFEHPGNGQIIVDYPQGPQYDYKFYDRDGNEIEVGYLQPLSYVMYHLATGWYRVVVIDTVRGCDYSDTVYVPTGYDDVNIALDIVPNINCESPYNGTITVNATSSNVDAVFNYRVTPYGSYDPDIEFTSNNVFTGLNSGLYRVEVKDINTGCIYDSNRVELPNNNIYTPHVTIIGDTVFCLGSEAYLFATAESLLDYDTNFHYTWTSVCYGTVEGQTMPINTNHPGACDYSVTVKSDTTGCEVVKTIRVEVEENPEIKFLVDHVRFLGPEYSACANTFPHNIGVVPTNLIEFNWSNQVTTDNFDVELPANNYCIFIVTVTDIHNCKNVDSIGVRALPLFDTIVDVNLCDAVRTPFMGKVYTYDPVNPENNIDTVTVVYTSVQNGCDSTVQYAVTLSASPEITSNIDFSIYRCEGNALAPSIEGSVDIDWHGGVPHSFGWERRLPSGGTTAFDVTNPLTYALNGVQVRAFAINSCGDAYTDWFTLKVDATPIVDELTGDHLFCHGNAINSHLNTPNVQCRHHDPCTYKWMISATENGTYSEVATVQYSDNGSYVMYEVSNTCGTTHSNKVQIVVDTVPNGTITDIVRCAGETISIADDDLNLTYNPAVSTTAPITSAVQHLGSSVYNGAALVIGSYDYFITLTNRCGSTNTNTVNVKVNDKPYVGRGNVIEPCINDYNIQAPFVDWNGQSGTVKIEYQRPGSTTWTEIYSFDDITLDMNGVELRFTATNDCGSDSYTFNDLPVWDKPELTVDDYTDIICEDDPFTLPDANIHVNWNNEHGTFAYEIRYSSTDTWTTWYNGNSVNYSDFVQLRVAAQNECGTVYDTLDLNVEELPRLDAAGNMAQVICNGSDIAPVTFTSNKELTLTALTAGAPALTFEAGVLSGVVNAHVIAVSETPTLFEYEISTVEGHCGTQVDTFRLYVKDKPDIDFMLITADPFCPGEDIYESITSSTYWYGNRNSVSTYINRANSSEWQLISNLFPYSTHYTVTNADTNARIYFVVSNDCGSDTAYVTLRVAADPVIANLDPVDTCAGEAIKLFVPAPTVTYNEYLNVTQFGWNVNGHNYTNGNTALNENAEIFYYVITDCGMFTSDTVNVTVHKVPDIDITVDREFTICSGDHFTIPTYTVNYNGATPVSTAWTIKKAGETESETLNFGASYDDSYDGATVTLTVTNTCGEKSVNIPVTVYPLPVPEILHDTIICHDGSVELSVVDPKADSHYDWYRADINGTIAADVTTYTVDATTLPTTDATYLYYVVETDAHNCISETSINASYQPIYPDVVSIKVTDKPRFIFKDVNGVVTHLIDGVETNDGNTRYSWQVYNPCYNEDTLVFVTFDIYFNGELIPDDSIGKYISNQAINSHQFWNTSDSINWVYYTGTPMHYVTYYASAQSGVSSMYANHYPNSNLNMSSGIYDDFYLHFLADRPVYKLIRPFRRAGEYTIVYTLWETSNVDRYASYYQNDALVNRYVGGFNAMIYNAIRDILVVDSIKIIVEGEDMVPSHATAPTVAPISGNKASDPVVKLYPNPAVNEVNADIKGIAGNTTIQVVNLAGKVVAEEVVDIPATGTYKYTRSVNEFTPGVYFIYFKNENATLSKKLVITK